MVLLHRETIAEALTRLDARLAARGARTELFLVGGAVMCLVHDARPSTKDVDAWFTSPQAVRAAAQEVAEEMHLEEDWLDDAAKAYVPPRTVEDTADIRFLADELGLHSAGAILAAVEEYFPPERLPVRTRLLLEEMFDDGG